MHNAQRIKTKTELKYKKKKNKFLFTPKEKKTETLSQMCTWRTDSKKISHRETLDQLERSKTIDKKKRETRTVLHFPSLSIFLRSYHKIHIDSSIRS